LDILTKIYEALIADQEIASQAAEKIKYYEFPDSMTMDNGPYIIIEPVDVPLPRDFADNQYLKYDVFVAVETWSKTRTLTRMISERIESIMWNLGLVQNGGLEEYDEGIFRNVKRYRGKFYRTEMTRVTPGGLGTYLFESESISILIAKLQKIMNFSAEINSKSGVLLFSTIAKNVLFDTIIQGQSMSSADMKKTYIFSSEIDSISTSIGMIKKSFSILAESASHSSTDANISVPRIVEINGQINAATTTNADFEIPFVVWDGLLFRLNADSLTESNGAPIPIWSDSSGNGRDAIGMNGYKPTLLANAVNGLPAVHFINARMDIGLNGTFSQPNTVVLVFSIHSNAGDSMVFDGLSGWRHSLFTNTINNTFLWGASVNIPGGRVYSVNEFLIATITFNTTDSSIRFNGVPTATNKSIGTNPINALMLGTNLVGTKNGLCNIAEFMLYDRILIPEETQSVETYLSEKYNIPLA
jgi:hypothetical protein